MIGRKIKEFRNLSDLTQSQLAERIGVTNAYISMLESGERTGVSLDVLKALARVLNTPINELLR